MKTRNIIVAVVIIVCALGSILYVSPTLLRPPAPMEGNYAVEYGLQYFPYLFDSINNTLVADLQPQWFRITAPHQSTYPYPNHEKLMKAFPDVNILMVIGASTMGADEEGCTYRRSNVFSQPNANARISSCGWSLQDWDANVSRLVEAFPNVHAWEIWNVPDFNQGGYLCCEDDVTLMAHHYFDMLKDAYQIIKAHNPNDSVIAFSLLVMTDWAGPKHEWIKQFVEKVWELGAADYCDAISFHAFTRDTPTYWVDRPGSAWQARLEMFEAVTGKPVWITETGMPSNNADKGATPESQATYLTHAFSFFGQYSYVKVVIWSYLYDPSDQADYGLLTVAPISEQAPKPAYYAFQHFTKKQTTAST